MLFQQKTVIKKVKILNIIKSFHSHRFIKFLTNGQPVRIDSWNGIENGKFASFSFWFFGWKKILVEHKNYHATKDSLYFVDVGIKLPFGLNSWEHHHIIKPYKDDTIIIDKIILFKSGRFKKYLIYPIMLFPVVIRKITYKIWFHIFIGND